VTALLVASPAVADPARRSDLRFGLGLGHGSGHESSAGTPAGTTIGTLFDVGVWVSDHVTFGFHLGLAGFEHSEDHPGGGSPQHATWRHSYLQTHAAFLVHWKHVVAGGGIGVDSVRETLIEYDGMSRSDTQKHSLLGLHLQVGVDIVPLGPGSLGVFGIVTREWIPLDNDGPQLSSVIAGLNYVLFR
jgi:hypothetical protein